MGVPTNVTSIVALNLPPPQVLSPSMLDHKKLIKMSWSLKQELNLSKAQSYLERFFLKRVNDKIAILFLLCRSFSRLGLRQRHRPEDPVDLDFVLDETHLRPTSRRRSKESATSGICGCRAAQTPFKRENMVHRRNIQTRPPAIYPTVDSECIPQVR